MPSLKPTVSKPLITATPKTDRDDDDFIDDADDDVDDNDDVDDVDDVDHDKKANRRPKVQEAITRAKDERGNDCIIVKGVKYALVCGSLQDDKSVCHLCTFRFCFHYFFSFFSLFWVDSHSI
jgi:hypothetical protein